MNEIWKDIPEFEGLYEASNYGRIRTAEGKTTSSARFRKRVWQQRIMKPKEQQRKSGKSDYRVELWKNGNHKTYLVSRLVALTWVDGYFDGATVNHIDGNPTNNNIKNLEWLSRADNIREGFNTGLYTCRKETALTDISGNTTTFKSMGEADKFVGRYKGYISMCAKKQKDAVSADGNIYKIEVRI